MWFPYENALKSLCKGKMKTKMPSKGKWILKLEKMKKPFVFPGKNFWNV